MDAHLFRRICEFLAPALVGCRIEKIHQVSDGVLAFTLYGLGKTENFNQINNQQIINLELEDLPDKKTILMFKSGKNPLLFFSNYRPQTGEHPPAKVMRLRKYLAGKRITKIFVDWLLRKIYLEISGNSYASLDLRSGVEILPECPSEFSLFTENYFLYPRFTSENFAKYWPDFNQISLSKAADNSEQWQEFPVLTPLLRKVLPYLDKYEGSALYADLQFGGGDIFIYEQNEKKTDGTEIFPFILPEELEQKLGLKNAKKQVFEKIYPALLHLGEIFFTAQNKNNQAVILKEHNSKVKKLDKLLDKLILEEERLSKMVAKKNLGLLLQANLYQLESNKKEKSISLLDLQGQHIEIILDPTKTIKDNMEHFFHAASRGGRGLAHLTQRRVQIAEQKEILLRETLQAQNIPIKSESKNNIKKIISKNEQKIKFNKGTQFKQINSQEKITEKSKLKFPSQVQVFVSSDGFTMLRGRDIRGNGLALKMASPFDYWVHTADGPSAHLIIRKNHPNEEVPLHTMQEAGILVALKSGQKEQSKALIQYSLVKYIRPMKNSKAGLVHIDKVENTYWVDIEQNIENKLNKS